MATTLAWANALVPLTLRQWYLKPGELGLRAIDRVIPETAAALTAPAWASEALLVCSLSAACWLLALILTAQALRRLARITVRTGLSLRFRTQNRMRELRTRVLCMTKRIAWRRQTCGTWHEEIELDELDIAVLDHGATLAPGHTISVPDLCRRLGVRPSVAERSLHKLHSYELVDAALGSTDGFGNFTLTRSGAWFLGTCDRDASVPGREASV